MGAAYGVGGIPVGGILPQIYGTAGAGQLAAPSAAATAAGGSVAASQSLTSLSSTSISATTQSLMTTMAPAANNNELLGAVLLMLVMEYLKTDDKQEKQDLTGFIGLIGLLLQQQQQQQQTAGAQTFQYSASQLSIQSTQMQVATSDMAISAYNGASATTQQAPNIDPGAAGLNVVV